MDVVVAYLDEQRAGFGQELSEQHQAFVDLVEVAVDAVAVGVAEGAQRVGVAHGHAAGVVLRFQTVGGGHEVGLEADAVGRVEVDHLHPPGEAVAGDEALHHLGGIAVDETVLPVAGVLVELPLEGVLGQAVEVVEQAGGGGCGVGLAQLVDHRERVHLLPRVQRQAREGVTVLAGRGGALAVPAEHRLGLLGAGRAGLARRHAGVAPLDGKRFGCPVLLGQQRGALHGGLVQPRRRLVAVRLGRGSGLAGHGQSPKRESAARRGHQAALGWAWAARAAPMAASRSWRTEPACSMKA